MVVSAVQINIGGINMKRKVLAIILMCSMLLVTGCGAVGGTTVATETTESILQVQVTMF